MQNNKSRNNIVELLPRTRAAADCVPHLGQYLRIQRVEIRKLLRRITRIDPQEVRQLVHRVSNFVRDVFYDRADIDEQSAGSIEERLEVAVAWKRGRKAPLVGKLLECVLEVAPDVAADGLLLDVAMQGEFESQPVDVCPLEHVRNAGLAFSRNVLRLGQACEDVALRVPSDRFLDSLELSDSARLEHVHKNRSSVPVELGNTSRHVRGRGGKVGRSWKSELGEGLGDRLHLTNDVFNCSLVLFHRLEHGHHLIS
jgi:hypothetical protein